jgi:HAE1 family hydrophobic/amphiphilic exporter-1/multidrug efflux pump
MGGMLAATFLAIFFIPTFFRWMSDWRLSEPRTGKQLRAEIEHHKVNGQRPVDVPHHATGMHGEPPGSAGEAAGV